MGKNDVSSSCEKKKTWRRMLRVMNARIFKSPLDENVFEGALDDKIYHGLKVTMSTVLRKTFTDICFCGETQEYLLLDRGIQVLRYSVQGKLLRFPFLLNQSMTFTRMLWCDKAKRLACFDPEVEDLWILNSSCVCLHVINNEFLTKALYYEPKMNEIIVVGTHQMIKYLLEEKEKGQDLPSTKSITYSDPEFGATWQLECTSLVPQTASEPSRLASSYITTLYLMPLTLDNDDENNVQFLKRRLNASIGSITALHYHTSSSWMITGDTQGNVMAWDLNMDCMMQCNEAHDMRVLKVIPHPSICGFISYSTTKLQVWSCNFRSKLESFDEFNIVYAFAVNETAATIAILGTKLYYLMMHQLYNFFAPLTSPGKYLTKTTTPCYPTKIIVNSEDNSTRIFSPHGKQLNIQLLPENELEVVQSVYTGNNNQLYTIILETGEILVSDTTSCPMKYRKVLITEDARITCITIYEYFDEIRDENRQSKKPRIFYPIRVRLIAGTEAGNLVTINEVTGKHENIIPAHNGSVIQLRASIMWHRVISLGIDRTVKVWRVFADLSNPLVLYYDVHFTVPITQVVSMGNTLCMVNSSEDNKVHQVLMENMKERSRLGHHCSKDHTAMIVNMIALESLEICATSSLDNTIRVWDTNNALINIMEINTCAFHTTFASVRGDIIFSAGRHLYKIPYEKYLRPKYRAKIVTSELPEEVEEDKVIEDTEYRVYDDTIDRNLMLQPVISLPLISVDIDDEESMRIDLLQEKQFCALCEYRDRDIELIKNSAIKAVKIVKDRVLMTTEDWDKYTKDLYDSITRPEVEVPKYEFSKIMKNTCKNKRDINERGVFHMLFGFSIDELEDTENMLELIKDVNLAKDGFLPNSVLYKPKKTIIPIVHPVIPFKKNIVHYQYPPEFYPKVESDTPDRRVSIKLSDLMGSGITENNAEV